MTKIIGISGPKGTFKKLESCCKCYISYKTENETVILDLIDLPKEEDFAGLSLVLVDPKGLI